MLGYIDWPPPGTAGWKERKKVLHFKQSQHFFSVILIRSRITCGKLVKLLLSYNNYVQLTEYS